MADSFEDRIFVPNNFTDFENLLFAKKEIKDLKKENSDLKIEIGKLNSEIQELQAELVIKNKMDKEERAKLRAISYNKSILEENKNLRAKNRQLKIDNSRLITELYAKR